MARVRCSCGREYNVPEKHLGQRVQCAACNTTFIATASAAPPPTTPAAAGKMRLGELAVARGLLSQDQVEACLTYQRAMVELPRHQDVRLGAVLVSKRLITRPQLDGLLKEQHSTAVASAVAAADKEILKHPAKRVYEAVTEEQRAGLRRTVEAATQKLAEKEAAAVPRPPRWWERLRRVHFALAGAGVVALLLVVALWPTPPAKLALVAYLECCDVAAVAPAPDLAWTDLGLAVREFRDVKLHKQSRFTYIEELAAFQQEKGERWADFLQMISADTAKHEALSLVSAGLPEQLSPRSCTSLTITVQPASGYLVYKRRGMGMYTEGRHLFLLLRVETPDWRSGWRVATCEPLRIVKR